MAVDYHRDEPIEAAWYSDEFHFFDLSYIRRSAGSLARFEETAARRRSPGRIVFAPAGHEIAGVEGAGPQQGLNVFLRASAELEDELELGPKLASVMHHCLNLQSSKVADMLCRIGEEVERPGLASALLLESLAIGILVETARTLDALNQNAARKGGLSPWRLRLIEDRLSDWGRMPTRSHPLKAAAEL